MCLNCEGAYYVSRWSKEAIDTFVELFNHNSVRDKSGRLIKMESKYSHNHGEVEFVFTSIIDKVAQRRMEKLNNVCV